MSGPDHIARVRPDPDSLEFDALRKQGIALAQSLSGDNWTDYNPHDPGVTILEQLCYGLTDLAYRSGMEVADYLAGGHGVIDYEKQALFRPQNIFPCRPVTADDYRKFLYDAIPDIEDIWFKAQREKGLHANGLFSVYVKLDCSLADSIDAAERRLSIERQVRRTYSANRNLCEDLDRVHIVDTARYYLSGEIEIRGRDPAKIFADIFFQCSKHISSGIKIVRYEDVFAAGKNREDIFCGPLTNHGYIDDALLEAPRGTVSTVKLIALIRQIEGVVQVRSLALKDDAGKTVDDIACDPSKPGFPELSFPETPEQKKYVRFALSRNTRTAGSSGMLAASGDDEFAKDNALMEAARLELRKLKFEFQAFRSSRDTIDRFVTLPHGQPRDLRSYYSIQNQFPAIYGINRYGVSQSARDERKAQAAQLKAYLYPCEQLMANYLQTLEGISQLFSVDGELQQTYFSQFLDNGSIPDIERLYAVEKKHAGPAVASILARRDPVADRRNRVLDALLAMYGEDFPLDALASYNYYRADAAEKWLIECKLNYLKSLPDISRDRNSAFDYCQGAEGEFNIAGLHKKLNLLFGLKESGAARILTGGILQRKILLTPDKEDRQTVENASLQANCAPVCALPAGDKEAKSALSLRNGKLTASMFRQGVHLANFVLMVQGAQIEVCFRARENGRLWQLACRATEREAVLFAHQFRNAIVQLNEECEGMYLVEHLLLRPRGEGVMGHDDAKVNADFYSSRISVVFPSWTARFSDPEFRKFAEETVCRNLAAHIYPEFYWLDFTDMCVFEQSHAIWLEALQKWGGANANDGDFDTLNAAADKLIGFLLKRSAQGMRDYWV